MSYDQPSNALDRDIADLEREWNRLTEKLERQGDVEWETDSMTTGEYRAHIERRLFRLRDRRDRLK